MMPRIQHVIEEEKITIDEGGMNLLLKMAEGDMRRSLNILQSSHMAFGNVSEDIVYKVDFSKLLGKYFKLLNSYNKLAKTCSLR